MSADIIGRSRLNTSGSIALIGAMTAASPTTVSVLKMFEPMIFPTAKSFSPRRAAAIELASSGSEVPTATMVSPISRSLTPRAKATLIAPHTSIRELTTNNPRPTISSKMDLPMETFSAGSVSESRASPPPLFLFCFAFHSLKILNIMMTTNAINSAIPSAKETLPSLSKKTVKMVVNMRIGMSRVIACFLTTSGVISAVAPRISAMFAIFEP